MFLTLRINLYFQVRDIYCGEHEATICHDCFKTEHKNCSDISADLTLAARNARGRIRELAQKLTAAEDWSQHYDQLEENIKKDRENNNAKINVIYEDLMRHCRLLVKNNDDHHETELRNVQRHRESWNKGAWERSSHSRLAQRLVDSPDTVLMAMAKHFQHRVNDLDLNFDLPHWNKLEVKVDDEALQRLKDLIETAAVLVSQLTTPKSHTSRKVTSSQSSASPQRQAPPQTPVPRNVSSVGRIPVEVSNVHVSIINTQKVSHIDRIM